MKADAGFTLFELVAALAIAVPLLAALAVAVREETEAYRIARQRDALESGFFRVEKLLERVILDSESSSWAPLFRIHQNGKVRFADGSMNPVLQVATKRQPSRFSDAITSAALAVEHTLSIVSGELNGEVFSVRACPRYTFTAKAPTIRSFLGLTADAMFEVLPSQQKIQLGRECRNFRLRATTSMFTLKASSRDLEAMRFLVPIEELRTLYVDRNKEFRYLGHRGDKNIENQALAAGIKTIRLRQDLILPWKIPFLAGSIEENAPARHEFQFIGSVARSAHFNFIANSP
ncbi:MAG: hypothetical protein J0M12_02990 [Deltaproteobacteria bacterium]|nr:hypothetical protein [Deltaproteobacteria bacterium]